MSKFSFETTEDNEVILVIEHYNKIKIHLTDKDISALSYGYWIMEREKTKKRDKIQEIENQKFLKEIESQGLSMIAKWTKSIGSGNRETLLLSDGTLWYREIGIYHYPWKKYDKIPFVNKLHKKDWQEKAKWFERIDQYKRVY
jgi:hypothetical protein